MNSAEAKPDVLAGIVTAPRNLGRRSRLWATYAAAVVLPLAALAVRLAVSSWVGDRPFLVLFFIPVICSAYLGGLGPGLVSSVVSAVTTHLFLVPPHPGSLLGRPRDVVQWLIFLLACGLVSVVSEAWHRLRRRDVATIARLNRAHDALRENDELFAKSFQLSPDCVVIVRQSDRVVVRANDALCRLWDRAPNDVIGRPSQDYSKWANEDDREAFMVTLHQKGECLNFETSLRMNDGRLVPFSISSRLLTLNGESCILSVLRDITERRQAEAASLAVSAIVESTDDAIVGKTIDGTVTSWNTGAERMFGYSASEIIGSSIMRIIPPDRRTEEAGILAAIGRGERLRHFETVRTHRDGHPVQISVSVSPIKDASGRVVGASKIARDIGERKRAEAALAELNARFASMFNSSPVATSLSTLREGRYLDVNYAFLKMFEREREEVVGHTVFELNVWVHLEQRAALFAVLKERGAVYNFEIALRAKSGRVLQLSWSGVLVEIDGDTCLLGSALDITERKVAEERIRQLNHELEQRVVDRTAQLEAANRELEAFSYSVSHDLRAPLRAVDGFSQAVMEDFGPQLPPEGQRQLQTIRASAQRMGELIDDLLAFSRLGRLALSRHTVEVGNLVRSALADLETETVGRAVEISIGELPACEADPALLKQVWINLLTNALKYSGPRSPAKIEIGVQQFADGPAYFVRDNGVGFDMKYADKLFGVFQRLHRADEFPGTGVGLAIVQRIVTRHGGRVWAEAAPDHGATFFFTISAPNSP